MEKEQWRSGTFLQVAHAYFGVPVMDRHSREAAHPRFIDYVVNVARQLTLVFAARCCWWVIHDLRVPLLARHGSLSHLLLCAGSAGRSVFLWMPPRGQRSAEKGNGERKRSIRDR